MRAARIQPIRTILYKISLQDQRSNSANGAVVNEDHEAAHS